MRKTEYEGNHNILNILPQKSQFSSKSHTGLMSILEAHSSPTLHGLDAAPHLAGALLLQHAVQSRGQLPEAQLNQRGHGATNKHDITYRSLPMLQRGDMTTNESSSLEGTSIPRHLQ